MLSYVVSKVREEEIFYRERTNTEKRVLAAFLYQVGLSYSRVEQFINRSYKAVCQ